MKRAFFAFAATLTLLVLPLAGQAAAETVVKHKGHGEVVVKHKPGHPNEVVVKRPMERRPHEFWHRGAWTVRVHGPAFRYPHGWGYRRWAVGAVLPALFLTTDYYYDDYGRIGLQSPAPGYRWVRYGDDLLLVNVRTGAVEDVAEDVFE
jgi:Ni/Co efflux regulator RcnB